MISIFSRGNGFLANPRGVSGQREIFPAAIWINLENFQNLFEDPRKSLGNILFSKKILEEDMCLSRVYGISAINLNTHPYFSQKLLSKQESGRSFARDVTRRR